MANDKILHPSGHADKPKTQLDKLLEDQTRKFKAKTQKHPLTEELEPEVKYTLPAGRGKIAEFGIYRQSIQKTKAPKNKWPFQWFCVKGNPHGTLVIKQYKNSRPIIFPEHIHLNYPDLIKLAAASFYLIKNKPHRDSISPININSGNTVKSLGFHQGAWLPKEMVKELNSLDRKYRKWIKTKKRSDAHSAPQK